MVLSYLESFQQQQPSSSRVLKNFRPNLHATAWWLYWHDETVQFGQRNGDTGVVAMTRSN